MLHICKSTKSKDNQILVFFRFRRAVELFGPPSSSRTWKKHQDLVDLGGLGEVVETFASNSSRARARGPGLPLSD
jgi:hypothetical protein